MDSEVVDRLTELLQSGEYVDPNYPNKRAGARRRPKKGGADADLKELMEANPETYKNQYVDDGSIEYEQALMNVIKYLAKKMFGTESAADMRAVPESSIKTMMKNLREQRQVKIDSDVEKLKYKDKARDYAAKQVKNLKYKKQLDAMDVDTLAALRELENPQWADNELIKNAPKAVAKKDDEKLNKLADALIEQGYGKMGRGRKKGGRKPNAFAEYVSEFSKTYKGSNLMKDAAKAYGKGKR
jgi:hypothetical protein